jgi:hypothetical protein
MHGLLAKTEGSARTARFLAKVVRQLPSLFRAIIPAMPEQPPKQQQVLHSWSIRRLRGTSAQLIGIVHGQPDEQAAIWKAIEGLSKESRATNRLIVVAMSDLLKLIRWAVVGLFRSRSGLQAEILILRHQLNLLRRRSRGVKKFI